jgi:hypothetical protein
MNDWQGDEIQPDGTVGGDGAHEAVSVRYSRTSRDEPAVITAYWYVVDERERQSEDQLADTLYETRPFHVEEMTVYTVCTDTDDPGGTETWSEIEYGEGSVYAYETVEQAEAERDRMASWDEAGYYLWDGKIPPRGRFGPY